MDRAKKKFVSKLNFLEKSDKAPVSLSVPRNAPKNLSAMKGLETTVDKLISRTRIKQPLKMRGLESTVTKITTRKVKLLPTTYQGLKHLKKDIRDTTKNIFDKGIE